MVLTRLPDRLLHRGDHLERLLNCVLDGTAAFDQEGLEVPVGGFNWRYSTVAEVEVTASIVRRSVLNNRKVSLLEIFNNSCLYRKEGLESLLYNVKVLDYRSIYYINPELI